MNGQTPDPENETISPFIVYLGCGHEEVSGYLKTLLTFYRCSDCKIKFPPQYLVQFESEIKVCGMQRYSDEVAFGLDYLIESEEVKHLGINWDEDNY